MAISNFIPQLWSARLQEKLQNALVFGALCNRHYEGEIRQYGDTVHINAINDITVKPYDPAQDIDEPEELSGTDTTLTIDHGAYYNFYLNDADAVQARGDLLDAAMKNAAERLAHDAETYILSIIYEEAGVQEAKTITAGNLYPLLVEIKSIMDTAGVPRTDRKMVLPPCLEGQLLLDSRFITGSSAASHRLAEGSVARAAGFDIYISCELENDIIAFTPEAVTFANQLTRVDAYRPERGFSDGVKGLCLSGAKVLMPNAVCIYSVTIQEDA